MTDIKRPDVQGIEARAKASYHDIPGKPADEPTWDLAVFTNLILNDIPALIAWIEALEARQVKLEAVVAEQAADDGLWFQAQTAPEAYLQQALRELHEIIEGKTSVECAEKTLVQMFEEGRNQPYD